MFYNFTLTIPAGTAESDLIEERVHLAHGVITHVENAYFYTDSRAIIWEK